MASRPPKLGIAQDFFVRVYTACGRSFPWRDKIASPFSILVAEILLKQTHAGKVADVWPSLAAKYPGADDLAAANPDELYGMIAELGFGNQRTRSLIDLAAALKQVDGKLPTRPEELMKLPYVGIYTAHAVACFAFERRVPVVDLSIVRVISRLAGVRPPGDIRRAPLIWEIAWSLLPQQAFKEHNYGLLDFATLVCKPRSPRCDRCHIAAKCAYLRREQANGNQRQQSG